MLSSRRILRQLKRDGWYEIGQRGRHLQLKHPTRPGRVTVPHPKKDVPPGTIKGIERQSGVRLLR